jgi:hypothetical protein
MCFPKEHCYEVVTGGQGQAAAAKPQAAPSPWYAKLWTSVQQADAASPK